jgi:xylulokinase
MECVAGIDAGTTGTTVMLVDLDGRILGSAYREYPCSYPHPGWVEQDLDLVWERVSEASRSVIQETGIDPKRIRSIGISSQRGTFVCVDQDLNPLHRSIVWNDTRASVQAEKITQMIGKERHQRLTGMPVSALWASAKLMWLAENRPRLVERTCKVLNGQELLLNRLGAEELFSDPSSLTLNGMMDIDRLDWAEEILQAIGLPPDLFPPMATPARMEGRVSAKASEETGFARGTPLCRGGGDQQCAAVGAGVVREGMAEITLGTAAMMVAHIDAPRHAPDQPAYIGGHAFPGAWDMEGGAFATGACLRWWRDVYGRAERDAARALDLDVFDLMLLEAGKAPPGCKGHLFFPFLNGQVTPYYDNTARGGTLGLTLAHGRPEMIRSVLEGTAFELRMVEEALEGVLGRPFESLRLTGGGAKSTFWMQILADAFGKPIEKLKNPECTTLGAAILGGAGAGVFGSIEEAVERTVRTEPQLEPDRENADLYEELFGIFRDAFEAFRDNGIYRRLSDLQDRL